MGRADADWFLGASATLGASAAALGLGPAADLGAAVDLGAAADFVPAGLADTAYLGAVPARICDRLTSWFSRPPLSARSLSTHSSGMIACSLGTFRPMKRAMSWMKETQL